MYEKLESAQESVLVKVKSYKLNFRNKPSTDGDVIYLLEENEILEVVEDCRDWYLVKHNNQQGYVMKEYVKEV